MAEDAPNILLDEQTSDVVSPAYVNPFVRDNQLQYLVSGVFDGANLSFELLPPEGIWGDESNNEHWVTIKSWTDKDAGMMVIPKFSRFRVSLSSSGASTSVTVAIWWGHSI